MVVWGDTGRRRALTASLLHAWTAGDADTARAAASGLVRAARVGLRAAGLRSVEMPEVDVDARYRGWKARVEYVRGAQLDPTEAAAYRARGITAVDARTGFHVVTIDPVQVRAWSERPGEEDATFKSILHELVHARLPWTEDHRTESAAIRGYEEGLAEGTAVELLARWAGITAVDASFPSYVGSYRALASVLGVDLMDVFRRLWPVPTGAVGTQFGDAVVAAWTDGRAKGRLRHPFAAGWVPDEQALHRMGAVLFASGVRESDRRDMAVLERMWAHTLGVPAADEPSGPAVI